VYLEGWREGDILAGGEGVLQKEYGGAGLEGGGEGGVARHVQQAGPVVLRRFSHGCWLQALPLPPVLQQKLYSITVQG
jgi:hypothetical protein